MPIIGFWQAACCPLNDLVRKKISYLDASHSRAHAAGLLFLYSARNFINHGTRGAEQTILHSLRILSAKDVDPRERSRAYADYRSSVVKLLPLLKGRSHAPRGNDQRKFLDPEDFSELVPIEKTRVREGGLHRDGLGLPVIGRITETSAADPNAPHGFVLAATALVLPDSDGHIDLFLADPTKSETIWIFEKELPLAMDFGSLAR